MPVNTEEIIRTELEVPALADPGEAAEMVRASIRDGSRAVVRICIVLAIARERFFAGAADEWLSWALVATGTDVRRCKRLLRVGRWLQLSGPVITRSLEHAPASACAPAGASACAGALAVAHAPLTAPDPSPAGRLLALLQCDVDKLDLIASLEPSAAADLLSRFDPRSIPRDRLREMVRGYLGLLQDGGEGAADPVQAPRTRKATPGPDDLSSLLQYDAAELSPAGELRHCLVRCQRSWEAAVRARQTGPLADADDLRSSLTDLRQAVDEYLQLLEVQACS